MIPLLAAGLLAGVAGAAMRSGAKPKFGKYTYIDPAKEQMSAIKGNQAAFREAGILGERVNEYSQEQLMEQLRSVIPDLPAINQNVSRNLASMTAGEIPQDVSEAVSRATSARSFSGGYGGSRFAGNLRTRDLGLTSLQMTQAGMDSASRWLATAKATMAAPQFDVTSMFLRPQDVVELKFRQQGAELAQRNLVAMSNAAYSPLNLLGGLLTTAGGAMTGTGLGQAGAAAGAGISPTAGLEPTNPPWG